MTEPVSNERYSKGGFKVGDKVISYGEIKEWNEEYGYWVVDFGDDNPSPDDYKYACIVSSVNLINNNDGKVWQKLTDNTETKNVLNQSEETRLAEIVREAAAEWAYVQEKAATEIERARVAEEAFDSALENLTKWKSLNT